MPRFQVDDKFHGSAEAAQAGITAVGAWTLAGSYCCDHLTDGRVPTAKAHSIAPPKVWAKLLEAKLVARVEGGYQMVDFLVHNKSRKQVEAERTSWAARQQRARDKNQETTGESRSESRRDVPRDSDRDPPRESRPRHTDPDPDPIPDPDPDLHTHPPQAREGTAPPAAIKNASPAIRPKTGDGPPPDPEAPSDVSVTSSAQSSTTTSLEARPPILQLPKGFKTWNALAEFLASDAGGNVDYAARVWGEVSTGGRQTLTIGHRKTLLSIYERNLEIAAAPGPSPGPRKAAPRGGARSAPAVQGDPAGNFGAAAARAHVGTTPLEREGIEF